MPSLFERLAEAWINHPHTVCGKKLDPYCAHHLMLLRVLQSPLLGEADSTPITWPSLFMAVEVCRTPYEATLRTPSVRRRMLWLNLRLAAILTRWKARRALRRLRALLRPTGPARRIPAAYLRPLAARLLLAAHARAFRAYQNDYLAEPDLFFDQEGSELTAPPLLARAIFVMRHLHIAESRVWTMPIGKLLWHFAACLEQVGQGVRLLEPQEGDFMETLRKIQAGEIPVPADMAQEMATAGQGAPRDLNLSVFGP